MQLQTNNQTATPAPISSRSFLNVKRHGFGFKAAEKRYNDLLEKKEAIISDIGEQPKPFKTILSFTCIGIAAVFAFIEAQNVKTTIVGATGMSETAAVIVGFAFAAAGLVAGEMLTSSWRLDSFSGRKKPTPRFFIALAFALIYLLGQYWLASRAGVGTGGDMQETVTTMKWFVLGIALAEILFGMAFLATAIKVFTLFVANSRIKLALGKMKQTSRNCEESWQRYNYECDGQPLQPESDATRDARSFYNSGGFHYSSSTN